MDLDVTCIRFHNDELYYSFDHTLNNTYDKRDDFDFDIVNFPFLDDDVPRSTLTGFIFLNLFGLLECLVMWLISMPVIKV